MSALVVRDGDGERDGERDALGDPWPSAPLVEQYVGARYGTLRQCGGYGPTKETTQGLVEGDFVRFPRQGPVKSSVATNLLAIYPDEAGAKQNLVNEWADKHYDELTGNTQVGWNKGIVPFTDHTCRRLPGDTNLIDDFIEDSMLSPKTYVLVNQLDCTVTGMHSLIPADKPIPAEPKAAKDKGKKKNTVKAVVPKIIKVSGTSLQIVPGIAEETHRPVAIACFTMSSDPWNPGLGRSLEEISDNMAGTHFEMPYNPGETFVVEIKMLCGHRHFAGAGSNMLKRVMKFAKAAAEEDNPNASYFICVLDSVDVAETMAFYEGKGFRKEDTLRFSEKDKFGVLQHGTHHRYVRVVRID